MYGILLVVAVALLCLFVLATLARAAKRRSASQPGALPYEKRGSLLSAAERNFLKSLDLALDGEARVFAKIRIEDLIEVRGAKGKAWASARGKIKSRHIDFALCDPTTFEILAAVELDDRSHSSRKAAETDAFKDACFAAAGIPLHRFKAARSYSVQELRGALLAGGARREMLYPDFGAPAEAVTPPR